MESKKPPPSMKTVDYTRLYPINRDFDDYDMPAYEFSTPEELLVTKNLDL